MFVKQIDKKTALELAAKGKKVLVMIPGGKDSGWEDMTPDSLEHMLEGCMFFRKEPAMEAELMELTVEPAGQTIEFGPAEPENAQPDGPRQILRRPICLPDRVTGGGIQIAFFVPVHLLTSLSQSLLGR